MQPSRSTWLAFLATVAFGACSAIFTPAPDQSVIRDTLPAPARAEATASGAEAPGANPPKGAAPGRAGRPPAAVPGDTGTRPPLPETARKAGPGRD